MVVRMRATVSTRNVNPRHLLMRATPSINIPTMAAMSESKPTMNASGAARLVLNSRDIHAIMDENRTIEQIR